MTSQPADIPVIDEPTLIPPTSAVRASYLQAMADFRADGRTAQQSALVHNMEQFGANWHTPAGFQAYLSSLEQAGDPAIAPPEGWVRSSTYWLVKADHSPQRDIDGGGGSPVYLGEIRIRHELTPYLLHAAGHIGYDIAPAHRRHGYGTLMLRLALPMAAALGIEQALLVCERGNVASRRIIERNGGVLEDEREGQLRFWVPTASH